MPDVPPALTVRPDALPPTRRQRRVVRPANVLRTHQGPRGLRAGKRRASCRPGGAVVIEVPAGPQLFDVYDKVLMHHRRYELGGLRRLLEGVGFEVALASSLGTFLYPAPSGTSNRRTNATYRSRKRFQQRIVAGAHPQDRTQPHSARWSWRSRAGVRRFLPLPVGIRCLGPPPSSRFGGARPLVRPGGPGRPAALKNAGRRRTFRADPFPHESTTMQTVFVTSGAAFIGSNLVDRLPGRRQTVVAGTIFPPAGREFLEAARPHPPASAGSRRQPRPARADGGP